MTTEKRGKFLIDIAYFCVMGLIIYIIFRFLSFYLLPFVIGISVSYLVQRPVRFLKRHTTVSKGVITVILVILTYLLIIGSIVLVFYLIYKWLNNFSSTLPDMVGEISAAFEKLSTSYSQMLKGLPEGVANFISGLPKNLLGGFSQYFTGFVSSTTANLATGLPNVLITIIVTVVASCFIAKDYDRIISFARQNIAPKRWALILDIKEIFSKNIFKMFKGYLLLMFLTFIELNIGFMLLGAKNSALLATIICIVDILPVLGTGTVVLPWAIIELIFGNIWMSIGLIIMYIIITIIRNFLEPKIIGKQVGLHPIITLLSMFLGLRLIGFWGLFLFPITLIVLNNLYKNGKIKFDFLNPKNEELIKNKI